MQKILVVVTSLITVITAILGLISYVGVESAGKYHLTAGVISVVLVLFITHMLYHDNFHRK
jgi:amino acid transporter